MDAKIPAAVHIGGYRTSPLSLTSKCVTVIAVAGQSVSVAEPCSRSAGATSPNNDVANNKTVRMPDGLAGVPAHAEAFGGQPAFRRPAGVATPQLRAGCVTSVSILVRARACPVDHGTGSRSQMLIEATSMVPW